MSDVEDQIGIAVPVAAPYPVRQVTNRTRDFLTLHDASGDAVQLPPGVVDANVPGRFLAFQMPPMALADVKGYDYAKGVFTDAVVAEVAPPVATPAPTPSVVDEAPTPSTNNNQSRPSGGSSNTGNR